MPEWKIYYADGKTFDSDDGSWEDASVEGVQAVTDSHAELGRRVWHSRDHYVRKHGEVYATDDIGALLRSLRFIKFGLAIGKEEFDRILENATMDPAFPKSSPRRRVTDW
jgi:hypothetical protein